MTVLDRIQTCGLIKEQLGVGRVAVSRYSDGEYALLCGKAAGTKENPKALAGLLKKAIHTPGQLVCVNHLKPHNIRNNDKWVKVQRGLVKLGECSQYGCANWNISDYQDDCSLLPNFFKGSVLLLTRFASLGKVVFKDKGINIECMQTKGSSASDEYGIIKTRLLDTCNKYDNILFSCGPIGKVLLVDLISHFKGNLIDFGSLVNAILDPYCKKSLVAQWDMSWSRKVNLKKLSDRFFANVGVVLG